MFNVKAIIKNKQYEFLCQEGEDILDAARKKFIPIPTGCRNGGCGMCKVKVTEGEFNKGKTSMSVLSPNDEKEGYTLSCKAYPKSDLIFHIQ